MENKAQVKIINLRLEDGTLDGVMCLEDSAWYLGEMYSSPRESVDQLIKMDAISKYGVYLLLSDDKVYIGQSTDLASRLNQHKLGKDWWERAIILTTIDNSFGRSDIDYLEYSLIEAAKKNNTLDSDNKKRGNNPKVSKFRGPILEQYIEEALVLLKLIGVTVFSQSVVKKAKKKERETIFNTVVPVSKEKIEIRRKAEAIQFLDQLNLKLEGVVSYAKLQEDQKKRTFWINPSIDYLQKDWYIILNNQEKKVLYIVELPANTFSLSKNKNDIGFFARNDKPQLDLNIDENTLIDRRSKIDLSPYVVKTIGY